MKSKTRLGSVLLGAAVVFGAGPVAADEYNHQTDWVLLGSPDLAADQSVHFDLVLEEPGDIVGFEFKFDYREETPDGSWASDLQVRVVAPSGAQYIVGGLTRLPLADERWSFDGPVSDGDGRYGDTGDDIFLAWKEEPVTEGLYSVSMTNDWVNDPNANTYAGASIRFYVYVNPCPADIDGSGVVDFADIVLVLVAWGGCEACPEDLNADGTVDFADILEILVAWGDCP